MVPLTAHGHVHLARDEARDIVDSGDGCWSLAARSAVCLVDARAVASARPLLPASTAPPRLSGRTLLQHGAVTTFGAACAGRLVAHRRCGGRGGPGPGATGRPAGTAGRSGLWRLVEFARPGPGRRGGSRNCSWLEPVVPWRTARGRIAEIAAAAGILVGESRRCGPGHRAVSRLPTSVPVAVAHPGRFLGHGAQSATRRPPYSRSRVHRVPGLVTAVLAGMPQAPRRAARRPLAGGVGHADRPLRPRRRDRAPYGSAFDSAYARRPRPHGRGHVDAFMAARPVMPAPARRVCSSTAPSIVTRESLGGRDALSSSTTTAAQRDVDAPRGAR